MTPRLTLASALLLAAMLTSSGQGQGSDKLSTVNFAPFTVIDSTTPSYAGSDAESLLILKSQFSNGDTVLADWSTTKTPEACGWLGVTCGIDNEVIGINLSDLGLEGTVSLDLANLPLALQELDLSYNKITGIDPSDTFISPHLSFLSLANNNISGDFQAIFRRWFFTDEDTSRQLALFNNSLSGELIFAPNTTALSVYVQPGNVGLCGEVPNQPAYLTLDSDLPQAASNLTGTPLIDLPMCPPPTPSPLLPPHTSRPPRPPPAPSPPRPPRPPRPPTSTRPPAPPAPPVLRGQCGGFVCDPKVLECYDLKACEILYAAGADYGDYANSPADYGGDDPKHDLSDDGR